MDTKKRTHVVVSKELVEEIEKLFGKRKCSWFITKAAKKEIQRLNFLKAVKETAGAWKDENHPELSSIKDIHKYVRKIREESTQRFKRIYHE